MDAIQRLRGRAQANGKLQSTKEQTVTVKSAAPAQGGGGQAQEGQAPAQYIVIEPTSPTEIYVPYYDPAVVYGAWPYPDYSPYYFPPPPGYYRWGCDCRRDRIRQRRRNRSCHLGQLRLGPPQHQRRQSQR